MDQFLKAIKCANCKQVLSTSVILRCNHNVCLRHVDNNQPFQCNSCGQEHQAGQFQENPALTQIIAAQIESLNLGPRHSDAKDSCSILDGVLKNVAAMLRDPTNVTYELISQLRNRAIIQTEKLKLE